MKTVIPLRIEGKYLPKPQQVSSPLADFTKLPWNDGTSDVNFDQPYVADGIIHEPFGDENSFLGKGLHLHFIIPHYLGKLIPEETQLSNAGQMPAAPNRWLITKTEGGTVTQWIVESDYVHHQTYKPDQTTCIIPATTGQPYRYMGRTTLLTQARPAGDSFASIHSSPLTVLGYGDPNFSSFYPNCIGAFGFYDASASNTNNPSYQVIGWNADESDDLLYQTITQLYTGNADITVDEINTQLEVFFKLELALNQNTLSNGAVPRTLFYGEITFGDSFTLTSGQPSTLGIEVALGSSNSEALSAHMGHHLTSGNPLASAKSIEDQLESILLYSNLAHLLTDVGPKFAEERHAKGFSASSYTHLWKVVEKHQSSDPSKAAVAAGDAEAPNSDPSVSELPAALVPLLDALNTAQENYEDAVYQIASLKQQLYLDWNKYMHARYPSSETAGNYPDADHIMFYLENYSITELENLVNATGTISYGDAASGYQPSTTDTGTMLSTALVTAWNNANALIQTENSALAADKKEEYLLALGPGPRYWEAHDPTLLISGIDNGASEDTTFTTNLEGTIYASSQTVSETGLATDTADDILTLCKGQNSFKLSQQKWNPFILDWEVELQNPHLHNQGGGYDPLGLQSNFEINQFGPDLLPTPDYVSGHLSIFSGTVLLSSHGAMALMKNIELFVKQYFKQNGIQVTASDFLAADNWAAACTAINQTSWSPDVEFKQPLHTAFKAYTALSSKNVLAQTLNGFNAASIMRKKTHQLPIAEPIGFEFEQNFTAKVKDKVGKERSSSPIMAFDFIPIRGGTMKISRLSLIDNFGVPQEIDPTTTNTVIADSIKDAQGNAFLEPRLVQPARLKFRWLAAEGAIEMNDHTDTTPICGWLMADYLNGALAAYNTDGHAIGYINSLGQWNTPPWSNTPSDIHSNISNTHLRKTVEQICDNPSFLNDFLSATEAAQQNIAPPNSNLFDTKSILMGKPMAVVRATVGFELQGLPAIDQSWSSLLTDMQNCTTVTPWGYDKRNSDNWAGMQLPVRLGEHVQLNDGLIGYWTEQTDGSLNQTFYTPTATTLDVSDPNIDAYSAAHHQTQWMTLGEEPMNVTMLIDPHGLVHATTGVLPVKSISIPPSHYLPAMKKMAMWFKSSSILQWSHRKENEIKLDLPPVEGYKWQWWDKFHGLQKIEKRETGVVHGTAEIWDGWLLLTPENTNNN